jgi:hypothetical protein
VAIYGIHTTVVEEVIEFYRNGSLLTGTAAPTNLDVVVVKKVSDVFYTAGEGGRPFSEITDDGPTFGDLQEWEVSKVRSAVPEQARKLINDVFMPNGADTGRIIGRRLTPPYYDVFCVNILSHLLNAARSRAAFGIVKERLFEKMFGVYKSGGFPCGFVGQAPDNVRLMAIYPGLPPLGKRGIVRPSYDEWVDKEYASSNKVFEEMSDPEVVRRHIQEYRDRKR